MTTATHMSYERATRLASLPRHVTRSARGSSLEKRDSINMLGVARVGVARARTGHRCAGETGVQCSETESGEV